MFSRSIADTLAVAAAGFCTVGVRRALDSFRSDLPNSPRNWEGGGCQSWDDAAMVNGMACHALDFDDLDPVSSAHLGSVLVPALLATEALVEEDALLEAVKAGYGVAAKLAGWLGPDHYRRGWHATSTIGSLAAFAALARLKGLSREAFGHGIGLTVAQAGGMQANFGSMAKALHAGFAAAAALRAIRLAECGVTGGHDFLSHDNWRLNFGQAPDKLADDTAPSVKHRALVKLYPCCFAAHRAVAAAAAVRPSLQRHILNPETHFILTLPPSARRVLRFSSPTSALEAAFSAEYCCALMLVSGKLDIADFDEAFPNASALDVASRITVETGHEPQSGGGIESGPARFAALVPGAPPLIHDQPDMPKADDPLSFDGEVKAKIAACLHRFEEKSGREFPALNLVRRWPTVAAWLPTK